MRKRKLTFVAGMVVLGFTAAACSSSSSKSSSSETTAAGGTETTTAGSTAAETTTAGSTETTAASTETTGGTSADPNVFALQYTGGKAGEASGSPIKIGYVNQEAVFPEATVGIEAAVKYVNKELGGVGGRPIELVKCEVNAEEDGQKCGTQFLNDASIPFVMTGTLLNGNQSLYDTLNGKKPVIIGNGVTNPDFLTTAGYGFETGSVGVIPGLAQFALQYITPKPKKVAVVYASNPAGQAAYASLLKPVLDKAGIQTTAVEVTDPGATAADVQSAMTAAGADTADVFIPLVTVQTCIATYDAIQQLGIKPKVVTTGLCFGTPMTEHLKGLGSSDQVPDGWYFGGYGYSYFLPGTDPGMDMYLAKIKEYGVKPANAQTLEYTGFSGPMFANLLTATKIMNTIGVDKITPDAMKAGIASFAGPAMLQAGDLTCGKTTVLGIPFPAVCGHQMGVQQYTGGKWVSIADAINGKAIDVSKI